MRRESFVEEDSDGAWKWVSPSSAEFGKLTMPQATRWAGIRRVVFDLPKVQWHSALAFDIRMARP